MYEIDKQKFGMFVSALRKEKGFTQKELARQLFISDKAVSKWETGGSIPDTALLIPLAELLEVTVTELLMCQRMEQEKNMDAQLVESVVKTAISYSDKSPVRAYQVKNKWGKIYVFSLFVSVIEFIISVINGYLTTGLGLIVGLSMVFGGYFCFFAIVKLPDYYDGNRICTYSDIGFQMSFPGLAFNNQNWMHILNAGRIWAVVSMTVYPVVNAIMVILLPHAVFWAVELVVSLFVVLVCMFVPIYVVGKKYE